MTLFKSQFSKISSCGGNYLSFYAFILLIALKLGFTQLTIEYLQGLQRLFLKLTTKMGIPSQKFDKILKDDIIKT